MDSDKQIVYDKRVLLGNWYESSRLEEDKLNKFLTQMKRGDLLLAKFRKMTENIMKPTTLTQSPTGIWFGAKIALKAPLVSATVPHDPDKMGVLLSGFLSETQLDRRQDLADGCCLSGVGDLSPLTRNTFVLTSADNCDREGEPLKYSQDFALVLASSVDKKPLYVRYDPKAIPGMSRKFPIYLSKYPVTNIRWRVLPIQTPNITRFEQEDQPVFVNQNVIINHSATNVNLAVDTNQWSQGFYGMECSAVVRNYFDVYKCERPPNIWHIHSAIPKQEK